MALAHTWRSNSSADKPRQESERSLLDSNEAAEYLGLRRTTLEAWRCRGGGPRFVKLSRLVKYRRADLDAFIESRIRSNTSGSA